MRALTVRPGERNSLELRDVAETREVLRNDVIFGSVNANMRHYRQAAQALAGADREWLARLITRRVPVTRFAEAFEPHHDVKVALELDGGRS